MNNKRVEGVYPNVEEAMRAVERLKNQGYTRGDITIVANEEVRGSLTSNVDAEVTTQDNDMSRSEDDDHSFWDSVKDFFTMDDSYENYDAPDYDQANDPVYEYRGAISQGEVVVLVNEDADVSVEDTTAQTPIPDVDTTTSDRDKRTTDDETIELKEERLDIEKEKEKTGEVHVGKRVVEDTETVEVPVTREEVTIERKPVTDKKSDDGGIDASEEDEIVIPVEEEKVKPKKETEVVEEVEVKKETKQDSETVGDTVRHEELEVEEDGDVLDSHDKNVDNPDDDKLDREISNDRFGDNDERR